jgi:hypothetical protein
MITTRLPVSDAAHLSSAHLRADTFAALPHLRADTPLNTTTRKSICAQIDIIIIHQVLRVVRVMRVCFPQFLARKKNSPPGKFPIRVIRFPMSDFFSL